MINVRVEQFWSEFFGVPVEALNTPQVTVVAHKALGSYEGAWFFMHGTSGIVSCPGKWVTRVRTVVSGVSVASLHDPSFLSRPFEEDMTGMIGPSYRGYLEPTEFRADRHHPVRPLSAPERPILESLLDCVQTEREGGIRDRSRPARIRGFVCRWMSRFRRPVSGVVFLRWRSTWQSGFAGETGALSGIQRRPLLAPTGLWAKPRGEERERGATTARVSSWSYSKSGFATRILLGLILLVASTNLITQRNPVSNPTERGSAFIRFLIETGYLFSVVKVTELAVALVLLAGRFVALALVLSDPCKHSVVPLFPATSGQWSRGGGHRPLWLLGIRVS